MTLIIPTSLSTYADSTYSEPVGDGLRRYILAQFRSDSNLEWVHEIRTALVREELKFRDLSENRPRLKQDRTLWTRVENGVGEASIIVIDPLPIEEQLRDLVRVSVGDMSPAIRSALSDRCASAIIEGTPIAYLPYELARSIPWSRYDLVADLDRFTPELIREQIGPSLRQAQVFAARAHAAFDLVTADDAVTTRDTFCSPLARVMLSELVATTRNFDQESPTTLPVLNEAADEIAERLGRSMLAGFERAQKPIIREIDSRSVDEIQAADIAAGWAREVLDSAGPNALGARFERVWINGRRIK